MYSETTGSISFAATALMMASGVARVDRIAPTTAAGACLAPADAGERR
jgi:hypothetical protein